MNAIVTFFLGLFVGGTVGVLTMGLVQLNHLRDSSQGISIDR